MDPSLQDAYVIFTYAKCDHVSMHSVEISSTWSVFCDNGAENKQKWAVTVPCFITAGGIKHLKHFQLSYYTPSIYSIDPIPDQFICSMICMDEKAVWVRATEDNTIYHSL